VAISEILGSLIMISITLISGVAVFGYVNGQSGTSAQAVGNSAASNINFLNERFVIVTSTLAAPASGSVYIYDNGRADLTIMSIQITGTGSAGPLSVQFADSATCGAAAKIYCYSDAFKSACDDYSASAGFTASSPQPESYKTNVPFPKYTFTVAVCSSNNLVLGNTYTVTLVAQFGNIASVPVTSK
jgi:hypothetical protein